MKEGKFIVIEGTDGSGKSEQFLLLKKRLEEYNFTVATFDFPQYQKESSFFVRQYLNGAYGGWKDVGPFKASLFYAMDRFDISPKIREAINRGEVVISNRYVGSNLGHQGSKLSRSERTDFFEWDYNLEFQILNIPKPDLNIVLHVPADVAQALVNKKGERGYLKGKKRDIHEDDINHLKAAEETYLQIVNTWPKEYKLIECVENGKLLSIPEIHEKIWEIVGHSRGLCGVPDVSLNIPKEDVLKNPAHCLCCGSEMEICEPESVTLRRLGSYALTCPTCPPPERSE